MKTQTLHYRKDPRPLTQVLQHHPLQLLIQKARKLALINTIIKKILNPEYALHCQTMNLEDDKLTLSVNSAVWSTKLRYQETQLLREMNRYPQLGAVKKIRYLVRTKENPLVKNETVVRQEFSEKSKQIIQELAHDLQDETLKKSLQRLIE